MRLSRGKLGSRPAVLLALLLLTLTVTRVAAQDDDLPSLPTTTDNADTATTAAATTAATATTAGTTGTDATATTTDDLPALTTATATATATTTATNSNSLPTLPTLSTSTADYHYPPPTVPPTANAPYMQKSNLPEGTVFIAVGAALGLIGLAVLAWRALVAWSVNRSVRRAAMLHSQSETKTLLKPNKRKSSIYPEGAGSTMSLDKLGGSTNTRSSYAPPKMPTTGSGLFYSPTASAGSHVNLNRGSTYLPAGYYAAAAPGNASTPGGGPGMSHVPSGGLGLASAMGGPQSQGYTRTGSFGPSPPGSPNLPPSRGNEGSYNSNTRLSHHAGASTSTLNINSPPQGRAPSAYLEDLFESHAPGQNHGHR